MAYDNIHSVVDEDAKAGWELAGQGVYGADRRMARILAAVGLMLHRNLEELQKVHADELPLLRLMLTVAPVGQERQARVIDSDTERAKRAKRVILDADVDPRAKAAYEATGRAIYGVHRKMARIIETLGIALGEEIDALRAGGPIPPLNLTVALEVDTAVDTAADTTSEANHEAARALASC